MRNWCQTCPVCASRKTPSPKARAPLTSIKTGYPLQIVAMDIMGPFPMSAQGNRYILVVSDYFTRWIEAYSIPDQLATTVAHRLTNEFFFRFGLPEQLHSDQGRNFESEVISKICQLLKIVKTRTTPYHPQSDGLVERVNRTLLSMMAMVTSDHPNLWESHLRSLCMAYNCSVQATTGYTPFYLMFGRQARMLIDIMYGAPSPSMPVTKYAAQLKESLENAYHQVHQKMGCSLEREKDFYDKRIHGSPFKEGDLVWLYCPAIPQGRSRKFLLPWKGPYRVIKRIAETTYRIQHLKNNRRVVVHFDRLKPCPPQIRSPQTSENLTKARHCNPRPPVQNSLELVDSGDEDQPPAPPPSPPPPRRYPARQRRPPDYYHNQI